MKNRIIDLLKQADEDCRSAEQSKNILFLRVAREKIQEARKLISSENQLDQCIEAAYLSSIKSKSEIMCEQDEALMQLVS